MFIMGRKIDLAKQRTFRIGEHFSAHIHGMFMHPHSTIKKVVREGVIPTDTAVPALVVLSAAILTVIGTHLWGLMLETSLFWSFVRTVGFLGDILWRSFTYVVFYWPIATGVCHFLGSIVSGKDIGDTHIAHRTLKLVGFSMVPFFLNILPYFYLVTGFWFWLLCLWSMEENYDISWKGSFIVTLPLLFVIALKTLTCLGLV